MKSLSPIVNRQRFRLRVCLYERSASRKLKGGALYISVLVCVAVGTILALFLFLADRNQRLITDSGQFTQLVYNLKSAFELGSSSYFTEDKNGAWIKNELNDDSIKLRKMYWGAYLILSAETKNRHRSLSQAGIFGTFMSPDSGLVIADNSRPVGMSGNIVLRSNCYLPRAGIKPAYIEGQSYISNARNSSYLKPSPTAPPEIDPGVLSGIRSQLSTSQSAYDSVVSSLPPYCDRPFRGKTLVWESTTTQLAHVRLKNNIRLVCERIEIDSSAHLENVLIICRQARFKKGFRGKVNVVATDSISMEEQCLFNYPSSFVILAEEGGDQGLRYIQFNKDCTFFGGVLALGPGQPGSGAPGVFVKLHASSTVNGVVYSTNYIHLEGTIHATVIAHKLMLKTSSAVYENHMLGCEIDPGKMSGLLAVPLLFRNQAKLLCCERVS